MSRLARSAALAVALVGSSIALSGQAPRGLDPKTLLKPGPDVWPTYNGDYSGRRFSTLDKINTTNVDALTLAWAFRLNAGPGAVGGCSGQAVRIAFTAISDCGTTGDGWFLDDIDVASCVPLPALLSDGFESGTLSAWAGSSP